jgi:hypothetical protein
MPEVLGISKPRGFACQPGFTCWLNSAVAFVEVFLAFEYKKCLLQLLGRHAVCTVRMYALLPPAMCTRTDRVYAHRCSCLHLILLLPFWLSAFNLYDTGILCPL